MKLHQLIDLTNWKLLGGGGTVFEAKYDVVRQAILTQLFFAHGEREVRAIFTEGQKVIDYVQAFMMSNKQKFIYIFDTSQIDFLSQDSTTSTLTHTAARLESGLKKNLRGAGIASGGKFSQ